MSITTRAPLPPASAYAASRRRAGIVHRIRRGESRTAYGETRNFVIWLCGGQSVDAILIDNPAPFGDICRYCDDLVTGSLVYHCYSATGQLLYIGSCVNWSNREGLHKKQTPWWPEVARVDKTPHPDIWSARHAEKAAIRAEGPLYNKQHNVRRFRLVGHDYVPVAA